ncbi:midline 1 [Mytilus galloprovincialis]|uniref:Midline 1 n=1 Tax=Mytilus galloprovincialis TaxID=29158 RepID=A0A8B6BL72_MYTGA|nr:midline 1 [Mytilus galloprovincialis]
MDDSVDLALYMNNNAALWSSIDWPAQPATSHQSKSCKSSNSNRNIKMDVDDDLQCPVCLELYSYPIILPCSHVLCREPCAEHLFDFNFIRCPVCRDNCYVSGGISSLPRVLALENIICRYKEDQRKGEKEKQKSSSPVEENIVQPVIEEIAESPILCQHCDSSLKKLAKKSCLDCCSSYCSRCFRHSHPSREPYSCHEIVEPRTDLIKKTEPIQTFTHSGKCSLHKEKLTLYCSDCSQSCCTKCKSMECHRGHSIILIEDAYSDLKISLNNSLSKLDNNQAHVTTSLKCQRDNLKDMQQAINRRRDEINMHCDALMAEIENKRNFFLADLEYEERIRQNDMEDMVKAIERIQGSSQALQNFAKELLKENVPEFLEEACSLNDKLLKASIDCQSVQSQQSDLESLASKVVDFRKEKGVLRDLHYLSAPMTPIVDVSRCTRSEDCVVLVLSAPQSIHDVIDQYEIHYCSEEQKSLEIEETVIVKNVPDDRLVAKGLPLNNANVVILLDNLCKGTTYYFCVSASNLAGKSPNSEVVQCTTLMHSESVIPVPVIVESLCRQFTSSIQVYSSSPQDITVDQQISHFLLYRPLGQSRAWKTIPLYGRQDHRVFGLESSIEYQFVILGCNPRGECQISNKIVLQTEPTSY